VSAGIYLARHATPDWERRDLPYHLPPGPPLTPAGSQEAAGLGQFLHASGVRRLFSSPLERCLHTAQIAAQEGEMQVVVLDSLIEWQPREEMSSVQGRMLRAIRAAGAAMQDGQPYALVTHGGPIAALLLALGMEENRLEALRVFDHRNPLPPAGVWLAQQQEAERDWGLRLIYPADSVNQAAPDQG
jgi:broad specificity phosphatase PhoE